MKTFVVASVSEGPCVVTAERMILTSDIVTFEGATDPPVFVSSDVAFWEECESGEVAKLVMEELNASLPLGPSP